MAILQCEDCQSAISSTAETCPTCGAKVTINAGWKKSDIISAVSAGVSSLAWLVALGAFSFGIWQFQVADNWKKREFVAAQIKEFYADSANKAVLTLLDYNPALVELFPNKTRPEDRYVNVEFDTVVNAIAKEQDFTDEEFQVRQLFEHFLGSLARFDYFVNFKAIAPDELCADFAYPVGLLQGAEDVQKMKLENGDVNINPLVEAVRAYLKRWKAHDVEHFFRTIDEACGGWQ
jgi:hypothetical protein